MTCRLTLAGETVTDTAVDGGGGEEEEEEIETSALAKALDCAMLCAVTVMALDGAVVGALYKPDEEIVPALEFPPIVPFTSQRRLVFFVPDTDARN